MFDTFDADSVDANDDGGDREGSGIDEATEGNPTEV